jgi:diaminopimelate decarboxylase
MRMASASSECTLSRTRSLSRTPALPVEAPVEALLEVVRRYGTPTYAYDLGRLRAQVAGLRSGLPADVEVVYSLKANASLGLCSFFASCGLGADVASAGEVVTAVEAGFPPERIFVSGPDKSPAMLAQLPSVPGALLSLDSPSELRTLAALDRPYRALLRLRPEFKSCAACSAGPDSRFGLLMTDLPACRPLLASARIRVIGFHIFAGSQVLAAEGITDHLRGALDQAFRAADILGLTPQLINLGGGFGVPYGPEDEDLEIGRVIEELRGLLKRAAPARLMIELGRYFVAQAGWYLTTVIAEQTHQGRRAVVVDGGSHQRGDMCGLGLRRRAFPPVVLKGPTGPLVPTDVLGCLSLPGDVLIEAGSLPPLALGEVVAFPNAGAYGLTASPILFHGHPAPAEVVFAGTKLELIRARPSVRSLLEGQNRLRELGVASVQ